jgi:hypothetical protein
MFTELTVPGRISLSRKASHNHLPSLQLRQAGFSPVKCYDWAVSKRTKKYLKIFTVLLVIVVGFHFIPIYSQPGYGDPSPPNGGISNNVCIGYTQFGERNYRVMSGGLDDFRANKKYFHVTHDINEAGSQCSTPVYLRLYIF